MAIALDLSLSPARVAPSPRRRPLVGLGRPRIRANQPDHARPSAPPAHTRKMLGEALALLRAGKPQRAGEICDTILAFEPYQPDALHMGGAVALRTGRLADAEQALGAALNSSRP
jgi:hypothetical protein